MRQSPADRGKRVRFDLVAEPGSQVFVAGTFNDWSPMADPLKDNPGNGHFTTALRVLKGTHEYKFVVNGVWTMDPACVDWAPSGYGTLNNILYV